MSNSFQYAQQSFLGGGRKGLQGRLRPLFSPGYGPVSNSVKVCPKHFYRGADFAP